MTNRTPPIFTRRQALAGLAVPAIAVSNGAAAALSAELDLRELLRTEVRQIRQHAHAAGMSAVADRLDAIADGRRVLPPLVRQATVEDIRRGIPDAIARRMERDDPGLFERTARKGKVYVGPEGGAS